MHIFHDKSCGRVRPRWLYALCVVGVICAGLVTRSESLALPLSVAKYAGDMLWGLMIFLMLAVLMPRCSTLMLIALAAIVCCFVEFSQLYHAPWLDAFRQTWFGRMTLGNVFAWGDMAAYVAGIGFGGVTEWLVWRARLSSLSRR